MLQTLTDRGKKNSHTSDSKVLNYPLKLKGPPNEIVECTSKLELLGQSGAPLKMVILFVCSACQGEKFCPRETTIFTDHCRNMRDSPWNIDARLILDLHSFGPYYCARYNHRNINSVIFLTRSVYLFMYTSYQLLISLRLRRDSTFQD